jgi:hypothetical protein
VIVKVTGTVTGGSVCPGRGPFAFAAIAITVVPPPTRAGSLIDRLTLRITWRVLSTRPESLAIPGITRRVVGPGAAALPSVDRHTAATVPTMPNTAKIAERTISFFMVASRGFYTPRRNTH